MGLFKRQPEPQPKQEQERSVVQETLDEMNALEAQQNWRTRDSKVRVSNLMLGHRVTELQRELLHDMDVIPVVDEKTGRWKLFGGGR